MTFPLFLSLTKSHPHFLSSSAATTTTTTTVIRASASVSIAAIVPHLPLDS